MRDLHEAKDGGRMHLYPERAGRLALGQGGEPGTGDDLPIVTFGNDKSVAVLRDIPGLILACPSNGADAARMLRECVQLAREEQRLVVFREPIALYPMRDLHEEKDGGWMHLYPERSERIALGEVGVRGTGDDLAIVTFGNGFYLSCQAQAELERAGIATRVIDTRWLSPLPKEALTSAEIGRAHV